MMTCQSAAVTCLDFANTWGATFYPTYVVGSPGGEELGGTFFWELDQEKQLQGSIFFTQVNGLWKRIKRMVCGCGFLWTLHHPQAHKGTCRPASVFILLTCVPQGLSKQEYILTIS